LSKPKHAMSSWKWKARWMRLPRLPMSVVVVVTALAVVIGGTAAASFAYDRATVDRILPGVRIAGIDVSGMTRQQALRAIQARAEATLQREITIRAGSKNWTETLAQLGMRVDPREAVDRALAVSASLSWMSRVYHRLTHHPVDRLIPLAFDYRKDAISSFLTAVVAPAVDVKPQDAGIDLSGDGLAFRHSRTGAALRPLASAGLILSAVKIRKPEVELPVQTIEPKVTDENLGKTLTVDLSTNTLHLYDGFHVVRAYPVATARFGFTTPVGEWEVVNKVENPTWVNPCLGQPGCWAASEPATIPPGPDNPLGTRALYLKAPGIRIHGTPEDSSIGTYASHGCIRMHIPDSEALYPFVPVGTKVVIYGAPPWGNIDFGSVAGT
jgi:lipoprotein-anchoring transpeptidase ErfK/SrfK